MSKATVKQINLDKYFPRDGLPKNDEFKIKPIEFDLNQQLKENQVILKIEYLSVDPYLRPRMTGDKTFVDPFKLHDCITSGGVGKVIKSNCQRFKVGEHIAGYFKWQEIQIVDVTKEMYKADPKIAPLSTYSGGILGMVGLTAYHGLLKVGEPNNSKKQETLVISAAAGAVGSLVGQIGKILGCRVVGIAGTDEKIEFLKKEFGFDEAINYKSPTYVEDLKRVCPNGIDIYWENVGGKVSDPIYFLLNKFARIPVCGAISSYNKPASQDIGQRPQWFMLEYQAKMQGFLVFNYTDEENQEALTQLAKWLKEGKLKNKEKLYEGFDQLVPAFLSIFQTNNKTIGKTIVKISSDETKPEL